MAALKPQEYGVSLVTDSHGYGWEWKDMKTSKTMDMKTIVQRREDDVAEPRPVIYSVTQQSCPYMNFRCCYEYAMGAVLFPNGFGYYCSMMNLCM